jgi:hypothetical protein
MKSRNGNLPLWAKKEEEAERPALGLALGI